MLGAPVAAGHIGHEGRGALTPRGKVHGEQNVREARHIQASFDFVWLPFLLQSVFHGREYKETPAVIPVTNLSLTVNNRCPLHVPRRPIVAWDT